MADATRRRPQNVAGDLFVDDSCIDCDACRWIAPASFDRADGQSRVSRQPADSAGRLRAHMALIACPTASIGSLAPLHDLGAAQAAFPTVIDGPVLHCGWHAPESYGAASWLLLREEGNVLIDSPRFARPLVERLEQLGGVHTMVLTHRDDVADHARFASHFGARRVLHEGDLGPGLQDVEVQIRGDDEVPMSDDLTLIPTPGHTRGSLCLLADDRYLFTGDHLAWSPHDDCVTAFERHCWYDWNVQRRSVERLLRHRFSWLLPGHGRMCHFEPDEMASRLRACLEWMGGVRAG